jgi:cell division septation protein DedD
VTHFRAALTSATTKRSQPRTQTPKGASDPPAPTTPEIESPSEQVWQSVALTDLTDASELLDDLENQGIHGAEFVVLGERSFLVRWPLRV